MFAPVVGGGQYPKRLKTTGLAFPCMASGNHLGPVHLGRGKKSISGLEAMIWQFLLLLLIKWQYNDGYLENWIYNVDYKHHWYWEEGREIFNIFIFGNDKHINLQA